MMGIVFSIYFQLRVAQVLTYASFAAYFNKQATYIHQTGATIKSSLSC